MQVIRLAVLVVTVVLSDETCRQPGMAHPDRPSVADCCRHVTDGNQELARKRHNHDQQHGAAYRAVVSKAHILVVLLRSRILTPGRYKFRILAPYLVIAGVQTKKGQANGPHYAMIDRLGT